MSKDTWSPEIDDDDDDNDFEFNSKVVSPSNKNNSIDTKKIEQKNIADSLLRVKTLELRINDILDLLKPKKKRVLDEQLNDILFNKIIELTKELESSTKESIGSIKTFDVNQFIESILVIKVNYGSLSMRSEITTCILKILYRCNKFIVPLLQLLQSKLLTYKNEELNIRLLSMHMIGFISLHFNKQVTSYFTDSCDNLILQYNKSSESCARELSLLTLRRILLSASTYRIAKLDNILSVVKYSLQDDEQTVRICGIKLATTLVSLSDNLTELETVIPNCMKAMIDPKAPLNVIRELSSGLGKIFSWAVYTSKSKNLIKPLKGYDPTDLMTIMKTMSPMFQRAPTAVGRAGIAYAYIVLLKKSATIGLRLDSALSNYIDIIINLLTGKCVAIEADAQHSEHCVEKIILDGVLGSSGGISVSSKDSCSEVYLESFARIILEVLARNNLNVHQTRISLFSLGIIVNRLGFSISSIVNEIFDPLLPLLSHVDEAVRLMSSRCIRLILRAIPSQATSMVHSLHSILKSTLFESMAPPDALLQDGASILAMLSGYGAATASVISISQILPFGIPHKLVDDLTTTAFSFFAKDNYPEDIDPNTYLVIADVGWLLLSSLISLGDSHWLGGAKLKQLFELWKEFMGKKVQLTNSDLILHSVSLHCSALMGMKVFCSVFSNQLVEQPNVLKPIVMLSSNALQLLKSLDDLTTPLLTVPILAKAYWMKTLLFDIFLSIPLNSYIIRYPTLIYSAVFSFSGRAAAPGLIIHDLLNPDDCLLQGRLDLKEELLTPKLKYFESLVLDSIPIIPHIEYGWLVSATANIKTDKINFSQLKQETALADTKRSIESEIESTSKLTATQLSTNSSIMMFYKIFPEMSLTNKKQLLNHFITLMKKVTIETEACPPFLWNLSAIILGIFKEFMQLMSGSTQDLIEYMLVRNNIITATANSGVTPPTSASNSVLAEECLALIITICSEFFNYPWPELRRCIGESLGILCRLAPDIYTEKVLSLLREKFDSKSTESQCTAAFTCACLHRYVGNMKSSSFLAFSFANLHNLGRSSSPAVRIWSLYSLSQLPNCSSFAVYISPIMGQFKTHLLLDVSERNAIVLACMAKFVASIIGVGPELLENKDEQVMDKCLTILRHVTIDYSSEVLSESIPALEQLLCWLPSADGGQSCDIAELLTDLWPVILSALTNECQDVRMKALKMMRQLVEKNLNLIQLFGFDKLLFDMLDSENDPVIISLLSETLNSLVAEVNDTPSAAIRWLSLCKSVINSTPSNIVILASKPNELVESKELFLPAPVISETPSLYKQSTRSCAMNCISTLLLSLYFSSKPLPLPHFLLSQAKRHPQKDLCLVNSLFDILTLICRQSDSNFLTLKIASIRTLKHLIYCFSKCIDPDSTEDNGDGYLLDMYMAQIGTVIRQSFVADLQFQSPILRREACECLVAFVSAGCCRRDNTILRRYMDLIALPLTNPKQIEEEESQWRNPLFASIARSVRQISHISAIGQLQVISSGMDYLLPFFEPYICIDPNSLIGENACTIMAGKLKDYLSPLRLLVNSYVDVVTDSTILFSLHGHQSGKYFDKYSNHKNLFSVYAENWFSSLGALYSLIKDEKNYDSIGLTAKQINGCRASCVFYLQNIASSPDSYLANCFRDNSYFNESTLRTQSYKSTSLVISALSCLFFDNPDLEIVHEIINLMQQLLKDSVYLIEMDTQKDLFRMSIFSVLKNIYSKFNSSEKTMNLLLACCISYFQECYPMNFSSTDSILRRSTHLVYIKPSPESIEACAYLLEKLISKDNVLELFCCFLAALQHGSQNVLSPVLSVIQNLHDNHVNSSWWLDSIPGFLITLASIFYNPLPIHNLSALLRGSLSICISDNFDLTVSACVKLIYDCLQSKIHDRRMAAYEAIYSFSNKLSDVKYKSVLLFCAPYIGSLLRTATDSSECLELIKIALLVISVSITQLDQANIESLLIMWLPLLILHLRFEENNNEYIKSSDLSLNGILKFASLNNDMFRNILNNRISNDFKLRLEKAVKYRK